MSIQQDSVGTRFLVTVKDEEGEIQTSLLASQVTLRFRMPDGEVFDRETEESGTAGVFEYITTESDLTLSGRWKVQAVVATTDGSWPSSIHKFTVGDNL